MFWGCRKSDATGSQQIQSFDTVKFLSDIPATQVRTGMEGIVLDILDGENVMVEVSGLQYCELPVHVTMLERLTWKTSCIFMPWARKAICVGLWMANLYTFCGYCEREFGTERDYMRHCHMSQSHKGMSFASVLILILGSGLVVARPWDDGFNVPKDLPMVFATVHQLCWESAGLQFLDVPCQSPQ